MKPTNEQIIAEAERRWKLAGAKSDDYPIFVIEVMREGWTPPEPADQDALAGLAYWDWCKFDDCVGDSRSAFIAGAQWGRTQERERAGRSG